MATKGPPIPKDHSGPRYALKKAYKVATGKREFSFGVVIMRSEDRLIRERTSAYEGRCPWIFPLETAEPSMTQRIRTERRLLYDADR